MKNRIALRIISVLICAVLCAGTAFAAPLSAYAEGTDEPAPIESAAVPVITVTTENGNGCELQKEDGAVNAHIVITDVDGSASEDDVTFKVRGNTTALSWVLKKSFTFKYEKKKDVLGMGKGKKWAMVSNSFDPTLLRNYLAFETADELGLAYTSEHKFVELWLDGVFRGSYVLFEPVQEGKDRVNIDIESNNGMKDFLVEFETTTATANPDDTYFTAGGLRFIASDPDEPNEEQLAYMTDVLADIIGTLKSGNKDRIAEKVDLTSFVKYYLLNEYFKTYDFSVTSVFYYYKDGILYAGPPWDYDLSMGNTNGDLTSSRPRQANSPQGVFADKNLLAYIATKDWFKDLVRAEYEEHYDYFTSIHADDGFLDALRATYSDTIERNYTDAGWNAAKWWINIQRKPDKTYEENYSYLKNWLSERSAWFEEYLEPFWREYVNGDTNGNGEVDILDATYVQRVLADMCDDSDYIVRGNVTGGELGILDATAIQRYLAGYENIYGIAETKKGRFHA